jgi:hypothetical protein
MLTRMLGWIILSTFVICAIWWWTDPAGFANNSVLNYLRGLSGRASEHFH